MATWGPGAPLAGLQGGGGVRSGLIGGKILLVRAYRDEMKEWVIPRSNSFFR
jgi:hypothetical protein